MSSFEYFICGDIGGTNSRMQLFKISRSDLAKPEARGEGKPPGILVHERKYLNQDFPRSFDDVCLQFLKECKAKDPLLVGGGGAEKTAAGAGTGTGTTATAIIGAACFAVAGPVDKNTVAFTNRSAWIIEGDALQRVLGVKSVRLINDFVGNGYGLLTLGPDDVHTLVGAKPTPGAPIACVGAGTGLGMTYLTCPPGGDGDSGGGCYDAYASEGGHTEFSPRTPLEMELLTYLKAELCENHRVSAERIVSGKGMMNVYRFLCTKWPDQIDPAIEAEMVKLGDNAGFAIAQHGHASPESKDYNRLCQTCMEIFWSAYGCEVGSAALKWLPFGGLYITGGIAEQNLELFQMERKSTQTPNMTWGFMPAYHDKGRVSKVLDGVPLHVVLAGDVGQRGAQLVALRELRVTSGIGSTIGAEAVVVAANAEEKKGECPVSQWARHALYAGGMLALAAILGKARKK